MKKLVSILFAIAVLMNSCNGQANKNVDNDKDTNSLSEIKVDKTYDKDGNLLKFDSTYTSYYTKIDTTKTMRDSTFKSFIKAFNNLYFFANKPYFNHLFFNDSLLKYDFYKKDFFSNRFKNNKGKMDSLFKDMDLMKNEYYRKQNNFVETDKKK